MGLPEKKKHYCGVAVLSEITRRPADEIEDYVNSSRKLPTGTKIVGMTVREVKQALVSHGFNPTVEDFGDRGPKFTDWKPRDNKAEIVILGGYGSDGPHLMVANGDHFVDSDNPKPTARSVYKDSVRRSVRGVIRLDKTIDLKGFS